MASSNSSALIVPSPGSATNAAAGVQDIRDIKEPVPIGAGLWWLWTLLAIAAIAALLWWLRKRRKKVEINPALLIPPHRRAKERLRAATELLSDPYRFCSLVSDVTRTYLEERFNLHAPDQTTEEFLADQRESSMLAAEHKALLENFLTQCDLVKFARHEPTEPELRGLLDAALKLIDETQEIAPPVSAALANAK